MRLDGEQGRIEDLKKEGAQGARGLTPNIFLANLGDFLNNLAQKSALDPRLVNHEHKVVYLIGAHQVI